MVNVENLSKVYRRGREEVRALAGLSLHIQAGELVGILGPSGSGKSTLLNIIGLLDRPTSGRVLIAGRPVEQLGPREADLVRRKTIGFVFQQFLLVPTMTALENVMLPMYFAGDPCARDKAAGLLRRVGLGDRMFHLPSQMSGGEIQRVAVARALANEPSVLLADEPTGNLDSSTAEDVFGLLREVNRTGTTVIVVTHNSELAGLLPRTIVMRDGRVTRDVKKSSAA
ncbi:MAG: ABC transporter ATP-binding protein [Firmicutes bacterium]|nr:ABC transporter ATP-binding protein [Bacillota bacterium]MDH7496311.1 ABC transporter ATP-binding protein [Bacillota bacterium]